MVGMGSRIESDGSARPSARHGHLALTQSSRQSYIGVIVDLALRMAAYFFSSPVDVDIILEGEDVRKQIESKAEKDRPVSCAVYYDGESVSGQVRVLVLLLRSLILLHFLLR